MTTTKPVGVPVNLEGDLVGAKLIGILAGAVVLLVAGTVGWFIIPLWDARDNATQYVALSVLVFFSVFASIGVGVAAGDKAEKVLRHRATREHVKALVRNYRPLPDEDASERLYRMVLEEPREDEGWS